MDHGRHPSQGTQPSPFTTQRYTFILIRSFNWGLTLQTGDETRRTESYRSSGTRINSFPMVQAFSEGPGYSLPMCPCRAQIVEIVRERASVPMQVDAVLQALSVVCQYMRPPMALSYRIHPAGHLQDGGQGRQI